jgi:hypothetical protein
MTILNLLVIKKLIFSPVSPVANATLWSVLIYAPQLPRAFVAAAERLLYLRVYHMKFAWHRAKFANHYLYDHKELQSYGYVANNPISRTEHDRIKQKSCGEDFSGSTDLNPQYLKKSLTPHLKQKHWRFLEIDIT